MHICTYMLCTYSIRGRYSIRRGVSTAWSEHGMLLGLAEDLGEAFARTRRGRGRGRGRGEGRGRGRGKG